MFKECYFLKDPALQEVKDIIITFYESDHRRNFRVTIHDADNSRYVIRVTGKGQEIKVCDSQQK